MVGPARGSREEVNVLIALGVASFGRRQVWASPALGIARYGRRQLWASTGLGVTHLEGVTRCPKSVLWPRWGHPPIPTSRSDRGGGDRKGGGAVGAWRPRASGLGVSESKHS